MAAQALGALFDIESGNVQPAVDITKPPPTHLELDDFAITPILDDGIQHLNSNASKTPQTGTHTPGDDAFNNPSSDSTSILQSWNNPPINKWRVLSCCLAYFGNGMNDSAPGALIPHMEKHYNIGYAVVSLVFIANAVGFLSAAFFTDTIKTRLGLAKTYMFSEMLMVVAYAIITGTPSYPAVVLSFLLIGWAMAMNLALSNVFCANLAGSTVLLGAAHGAYGIGGVVGPIIATSIVSKGAIWSRYYLVTLVVCLLGTMACGWSFRGFETEQETQLLSALERTASNQNNNTQPKRSLLLQALRYGVTLIGALFTFAYQGAEVSISGWVISFLITERKGDPAHVGYVTAGFWGGITLGRFTLAYVAARFGERRFVFVLGTSAIAFQLLIWFVPNVIGDSIAVALVGFVLGPVAPCSTVVFLRLLPRSIQTTSVGFISSAGSSGGAVWPFITGLIAQGKGTYVLHPVCIALFILMVGCWWMLPSTDKRTD